MWVLGETGNKESQGFSAAGSPSGTLGTFEIVQAS